MESLQLFTVVLITADFVLGLAGLTFTILIFLKLNQIYLAIKK